MANWHIEHSCGHSADYQMSGPRDGRERKAAWLASSPCKACEDQARAEADKTAALPELTGTPKQISWARGLRQTVIAELPAIEARLVAFQERESSKPSDIERARATLSAIAHIRAQVSAGWWIDNRHASAQLLVVEIIKELACR